MYDYNKYQMDILQEALETFEIQHAEVKHVMDVIDDIWDVTIVTNNNPRITRFYGKYWHERKTIELVPHKFKGNLLAYKDTILHELAHHIAFTIYGFNIRPHGKEWQNVCRILGCNDFSGKSLVEFEIEWNQSKNIAFYTNYRL